MRFCQKDRDRSRGRFSTGKRLQNKCEIWQSAILPGPDCRTHHYISHITLGGFERIFSWIRIYGTKGSRQTLTLEFEVQQLRRITRRDGPAIQSRPLIYFFLVLRITPTILPSSVVQAEVLLNVKFSLSPMPCPLR